MAVENSSEMPAPGGGGGSPTAPYSFVRDAEMPIAILFPLGLIFFGGVAIVQGVGHAGRERLGRGPAYAGGVLLALPFLLVGALPLALGFLIVVLLKGIRRFASKGYTRGNVR
jgi:hypothetical protein